MYTGIKQVNERCMVDPTFTIEMAVNRKAKGEDWNHPRIKNTRVEDTVSTHLIFI